MRGLARHVVAVATVAAMFGAVALAGLLVSAPTLHTGPVLDVPPEGEVAAAFLPDGEPVFVANHGGGDVQVLAALTTHLGMPAVWCPRARSYIELGHSTSFDERGRYLGGPAPSGLAPFAVEVLSGPDPASVRVGPRQEPPPRTEGALLPQGAWCSAQPVAGVIGGERYVDAIAHDLDALPGPLPVTEARKLRGFAWVDGLLVVRAGGDARLCDAAHGTPSCPDDAAAVRAGYHSDLTEFAGWMRGRFLVRGHGGGFETLAGPYWLGEGDPDDRDEGTDIGEPGPTAVAQLAEARIAGVERHADDWLMLLSRPVEPRADSGARLDGATPVQRVPLHERHQISVLTWEPDERLFDDGLHYSELSPGKLARLTDERGELEARIELDADGRATLVDIEVPPRNGRS